MLVGEHERVVAEPARRVQLPSGDRTPRRLVRARPLHRRSEDGGLPAQAHGKLAPPPRAVRIGENEDAAHLERRTDGAHRHAVRHPQRVSVAERHHRELSRQRPARLLGGTLDGGGVRRLAAQQQFHQRVAARLRGAFEQGLLARVAGHRSVREAVDVGEDRLGEDDQRARVQGRLGQLHDGPPCYAGADAVRRLQRVERAPRAELGPSDRLVDVVVGQVDGAAEEIHELLQRRRRAVAEEPSELTLERLVVLDHLGAHRRR